MLGRYTRVCRFPPLRRAHRCRGGGAGGLAWCMMRHGRWRASQLPLSPSGEGCLIAQKRRAVCDVCGQERLSGMLEVGCRRDVEGIWGSKVKADCGSHVIWRDEGFRLKPWAGPREGCPHAVALLCVTEGGMCNKGREAQKNASKAARKRHADGRRRYP